MRCAITGDVVDLNDVCKQITDAQEDVELVINSPGGDVFAGFQLVNAISKCPYKVTARIEVMAASIAAIIALACDEVSISKNDLMMLHNCWTFSVGNKEQLQQDIEMMAAVDKVLHNIISEHCKDENINEKIDAGDVWLVGEEVVEMFDHVELREENEVSLAAGASLAKLVLMARETEEERRRRKKKNVPPPPEPTPDPDPDPDPDDPDNPDDPNTPSDPDTPGDGGDDNNDDPADGGDDNNDDPPADGGDGDGGDTPPSGYFIPEELKSLLKEVKELE